ncbi:hypothetical protein Goari_006788 [Gossypium aridum]|uniref:Uncharacterized protein n=1 Tax=Gossypium aridum TaxID=34290 RepID=A0A7J8XP13_GOSAI|nr:hypothetical protein [Gossypium aridum]
MTMDRFLNLNVSWRDRVLGKRFWGFKRRGWLGGFRRQRRTGAPGTLLKRKILSEIGRLVGRVAKLDFNTVNRTRGRFARMVIYVNLDKSIVSHIRINEEMQSRCHGEEKETTETSSVTEIVTMDDSEGGVFGMNLGLVNKHNRGSNFGNKEGDLALKGERDGKNLEAGSKSPIRNALVARSGLNVLELEKLNKRLGKK